MEKWVQGRTWRKSLKRLGSGGGYSFVRGFTVHCLRRADDSVNCWCLAVWLRDDSTPL